MSNYMCCAEAHVSIIQCWKTTEKTNWQNGNSGAAINSLMMTRMNQGGALNRKTQQADNVKIH